MGVKLDPSHWERNVGWDWSRIWCYIELLFCRWWESKYYFEL